MHLNGSQLGRSQIPHVTLTTSFITQLTVYQAFKRHAELGYLALSTDLSNVTLPGNIPYPEWDSWHSLIITDELSRVVRQHTYVKSQLTS